MAFWKAVLGTVLLVKQAHALDVEYVMLVLLYE